MMRSPWMRLLLTVKNLLIAPGGPDWARRAQGRPLLSRRSRRRVEGRSAPAMPRGGIRCALASDTSQRLDLDLAELHDALVLHDPRAVLQRDPPARELAVLDAVDGLVPVEDHGECRALGRDLVDVPFAAGLGHRLHLGDVDDRTRAVARIGALV